MQRLIGYRLVYIKPAREDRSFFNQIVRAAARIRAGLHGVCQNAHLPFPGKMGKISIHRAVADEIGRLQQHVVPLLHQAAERVPQLGRFVLRAGRIVQKAHARDRHGHLFPVGVREGRRAVLPQQFVSLVQRAGFLRCAPLDRPVLRLRPDGLKICRKLTDGAVFAPIRHDQHIAVDVSFLLI